MTITCFGPVFIGLKMGFPIPMDLAACGGAFLDRINKIFLFSLYLPAGRQVLNILS